MARITIEYDGRDAIVKKVVDLLLSFKNVKIKTEESPYDPEFIAKIERSRNSKGEKIKLEDLWK